MDQPGQLSPEGGQPKLPQRPSGDGDPFAALRSDDAYFVCQAAGEALAADSRDQMAALNALIEAQRLARQRMRAQIELLQQHYLKVSAELQSERHQKRSTTLEAGCEREELEALREELSRERHSCRCQSQEAAAAAADLAEARADAQQQRAVADCAVRSLAGLRARCQQLEEGRLQAEEPERLKRIIVKMLQEIRRLRDANSKISAAQSPGGSGCRSADCAAALRLERRNAERLAQEVKRLQLLLAANDVAATAAEPLEVADAAPSSAPAVSTSTTAAATGAKRVADRRPVPAAAPPGSAGRSATRGPPSAAQQPQQQAGKTASGRNGATATVKRASQSAGPAISSPARRSGASVSTESAPGPAATVKDLQDWLAGLPDRFNRQLQALVSPDSPTELVGPALLLDCPTPQPGADVEAASRQVVDWLVRVWNGRLLRIVADSLTRRLPSSAGGTVLYYFVQQLLDTGCPLPAKLRTDFLRRLDGFPGNGRLRQDVHQVKMRVRPLAVTRPAGAATPPSSASKRVKAPGTDGGPEAQQPAAERSASARTGPGPAVSASPRRPATAAAASRSRAAAATANPQSGSNSGSSPADAAKTQKGSRQA